MKYDVTVNIGNFNGMRNQINGKGRIQTTIESLLETVPQITEMDVRITDNFSEDGSWEYVSQLPFGKIRRKERVSIEPRWIGTTMNNMGILRDAIEESNSKFIWNIENDSYFLGGGFLEKAIEVLAFNEDISVVHLKRWTPLCAEDSPGVPTNLTRYSEARTSMQLDFANGKRTEIESFTGYVVRMAEESRIEVPNYKMVYELLKKR